MDARSNGDGRVLVLVGGGHAHVEVLRRLAESREPGLAIVVVCDRARALYSGMVPGFVAGQYAAGELEIDVPALAARAGARWIGTAAVGIDAARRRVALADGSEVAYDLASLDVGSTVAGLATPGVREHALSTRPIAEFVARIPEVVARCERGRSPHVVVVGGGAAGVELAFCTRARIARETGGRARVTIVEGGPELLPGATRALRGCAMRAAARAAIAVRTGRRVVEVAAGGVELDSDEALAADLVVWATGAAAHPFVAESALPAAALDERGFARVGATLEVAGCDGLFAVGDCASLPGTAKAGVYAVRQGPVLADNLRAAHRGEPLARYAPQRDFLRLLNLGDGTAIAAKWGLAAHGALAMRLKDRIDRGFMRRYR